ncbi:MAG: polysaccharide pyruvyl transferase family protein [Kiritimatiellae bacterium]|nr:polysaccharide pyruvyl transferase family protein [Kiritimatiellia bacterium]
MKKIAHFGAFDHDSYGDLLFPKLAEYLLPDFAITHVAPTATTTEWSDACPVIALEEAVARNDWDGILVGGGDIIQSGGWRTRKWRDSSRSLLGGLPGLWMGAAFLSAKLNIPAAWNAPGVPLPFPDWFAEYAALAGACTDYVAVRDADSRANLGPVLNVPISVVPDTALMASRIWPLAERQRRLALSLSCVDTARRHADMRAAVHNLIRELDLDESDIVVAPLLRWELEEYPPEIVRQEAPFASRAPLPGCPGLVATARLIGGSSWYVGNSLHGLITAVSYGIPAVIVVPVHNKGAHKYRGFLEAAGLDPAAYLANCWTEAGDLLLRQKPARIAEETLATCERHVGRLRSVLSSGPVDKAHIWRRLASSAHQRSETLCLMGTPVEHLCAHLLTEEHNLALATDREMALVSAWQSWQQSRLGRLSNLIARLLRFVANAMRWSRGLLDAALRTLLLNALERHWIGMLGLRRVRELPGLDWLLSKLQLPSSSSQVIAKIGPYLTRREEALYREAILPLRAAGQQQPSRMCRPEAPSATRGAPSCTRRRILFVCGEFPNPVHGGGGRVAGFVKALSRHHDVLVAAWYKRECDAEAYANLRPYCRSLLRLSIEDLEHGCAAKILKALGGQPADIVHYEWPRSLRSFDRRLGRCHIYTHMESVSCSLWMDLQRLEPLSQLWLRRLT